MATLEEVTYELALRALAQQESLLDELRSRTGTLLTAASLIGSFLGATAIRLHGLSIPNSLALAAFGVAVITSIYVLFPKQGLQFALSGPVAYEALYEFRDDNVEVHRRLTYWVQQFRAGNQPAATRATLAFRLATLALVAELVLLALGLAT